jgi:PAS domain S-box-containing protein
MTAKSDEHRAREFFRSILNEIPEGVWVTDGEDRIVFFNPAMERISGAAAAEVVGLKLTADFPQETVQHFLPPYFKAKGNLEAAEYEAEVVTPVGRPTVQAGWLVPLVRDGHFNGMLCTALDITEKKAAEKELERMRSRARHYLDITPSIILALDGLGNITLLNQEGARILECEGKNVIGRNWFDSFLPEEAVEDVKKNFQSLMRGDLGSFGRIEQTVRTRKGRMRLILWRNSLLRDEEGRVTGTLSSGEDITDRKRTEDALRESEERYRLVTSLARDIVWQSDPNWIMVYASPSTERVLGYTVPEVLGRPIADFMAPEDVETMREVTAARLSGELGPESPHTEYRLKHKDGRLIDAEAISAPMHDEHGRVAGLVGITRDITERKRAEKEILELNRKLEERVAQRTAELEAKNRELEKQNARLEHFNDLFVGREFRIKELKEKIKELESRLGPSD